MKNNINQFRGTAAIFAALFIFINGAYGQKTIKASVYFKSDQYELDKSAKTTLDSLYAFAKRYQDFSFDIYGNTDSIGSKAFNEKLSENRIGSVKNYMLETGIPDSKIKGYAFGEEKAKFNNGNEKGRARNRRVDIVLKVVKIDRDTTVARGLLTFKIPAYTFEPNYNDELIYNIDIVDNNQSMIDNGLNANDENGNRLNSGGMACITIRDARGNRVLPTRMENEIIICFPAYENDPNMRPYLWMPDQNFWALSKLYWTYSERPNRHFELHMPAKYLSLPRICINWDKKSPISNWPCSNPFAYRNLPRDFDTTAKFFEDGSIIKFDGGSFAPNSIQSITTELDWFSTPGSMIKDSISSVYAGNKFLSYECINKISFYNYNHKKLKINQGHKAMLYYHFRNDIRDKTYGQIQKKDQDTFYKYSLGERDKEGIIRWQNAPGTRKIFEDSGCTFLVVDLFNENYISNGLPLKLNPLVKGNTISENGDYQVNIKKNVQITKSYLVYTQSNVVLYIKPDSLFFNIKAYEKPAKVRLIVISKRNNHNYISQVPLSRLKYKKGKGYYILRRHDFKKVRDGKNPLDLVR